MKSWWRRSIKKSRLQTEEKNFCHFWNQEFSSCLQRSLSKMNIRCRSNLLCHDVRNDLLSGLNPKEPLERQRSCSGDKSNTEMKMDFFGFLWFQLPTTYLYLKSKARYFGKIMLIKIGLRNVSAITYRRAFNSPPTISQLAMKATNIAFPIWPWTWNNILKIYAGNREELRNKSSMRSIEYCTRTNSDWELKIGLILVTILSIRLCIFLRIETSLLFRKIILWFVFAWTRPYG